MVKTNAETCREYRRRKKMAELRKAILEGTPMRKIKTAAERARAYRLRKKQSLLTKKCKDSPKENPDTSTIHRLPGTVTISIDFNNLVSITIMDTPGDQPKADEVALTSPDVTKSDELSERVMSQAFSIKSNEFPPSLSKGNGEVPSATEAAPRDIRCVNPNCDLSDGSYYLADVKITAFYGSTRQRALVCENCLRRVRNEGSAK